MTPSRQSREGEQAEHGRPFENDPVLAGLREVEARYREIYAAFEHRSQGVLSELARVRSANESLGQDLATKQHDLDEQRLRAQRQQDTAQALTAALKEIHRSVFSGNVYDLILKACLTLTAATRGLFVTASGDGSDILVRAAVDVNDYPSSPPSSLIVALTRTALDNEIAQLYEDSSALPGQPDKSEMFRNCLVAPVVLRNDLSGVVIVADKAGGAFHQADADVLLSVGSHAAIAVENNRLQREVHDAYLSIVTLLAGTIAARNRREDVTSDVPSRLAAAVARHLGLPERDQSVVYYATLLRDIGNIGVSDGVLNKPGPLIEAERVLVRAHVEIGNDLLRHVAVLNVVADIVRHHHERFDGHGYPDRVRGADIPIAARIVAVVDAFFAMLSQRSYRQPLSREMACEELRRGAGSQFDPRVVEAFVAVLDETTPSGASGTRGPDQSLPSLLLAAAD